MEEFAKKEYKDYWVLDFAREGKDIRRNFEENMDDMDTFFRNLFLLKGKSLLEKESVIIHITAPEVSLEAYADRGDFKLYMGDTGLLVTPIMKNSDETETGLYKALIFDKLGINQGMILENMTAQILKTNGYRLYFHEFMFCSEEGRKEKKNELDFLIVKKKKICPIEVKSSGYKAHKSFDCFVKKYPIKIEGRYIIYGKDLKVENGITYILFYMTICL